MYSFVFNTGIENSYPTIALPDGTIKRRDEMESTGHYKYWRTDFDLAKEIGVDCLRYGPPYYRTHLGPGRYDWSFADETYARLKEINLVPITDLCHFGVPDFIGSFQNPDFPALFAEYAQAFAKRFPWVRVYTPVNEIYIAALFSGQYGWWNERLKSDKAFVTALKHLCKANVMAMHAIRDVLPREPLFVQSESSEYFHSLDPAAAKLASFNNEKRFLALDLTYGHAIDVRMFEYLLDNAMTSAEYHWFIDNHLRSRCVMGNDYYQTNEHMVHPDHSVTPSGEIFGYYVITHQYYNRYHLPVMHTETNTQDPEAAPGWLRKEWANLHRLRQDGVPILGFTWYSLQDQIDWDTAMREENHHVNACGLFDLNRNIRPVGIEYKKLIGEWRNQLPQSALGFEIAF